jgi:hypothetical protein
MDKFPTTPENIMYCDDLIAGTRPLCGRDQDFGPMAIMANRHAQRIFLRSHGFNAERTYLYEPLRQAKDERMEYPSEPQPQVELKVKAWTTPSFGVQIMPEGIFYGSFGWNLTAHKHEPDYATLLWSVNVPDYITESDLTHSSEIKRIRLLSKKNVAYVEADLTEGDHELSFRSDIPAKYIHVESPRRVGRRLEIYFHNDASEVGVAAIFIKVGRFKMGGMWWDGEYYETINALNHSAYDWLNGMVYIFTGYPNVYKLRHGATRLSFEILGELPE